MPKKSSYIPQNDEVTQENQTLDLVIKEDIYLRYFKNMLQDSLDRALGENWDKAYGQGTYRHDNSNYQTPKWQDNPFKDIAMMALRPISLAISSAITFLRGMVQLILSPLGFTKSAEAAKRQALTGIVNLAFSVSNALLIAVASLARMFNMVVRTFNTITHALSDKQKEGLELDSETWLDDLNQAFDSSTHEDEEDDDHTPKNGGMI